MAICSEPQFNAGEDRSKTLLFDVSISLDRGKLGDQFLVRRPGPCVRGLSEQVVDGGVADTL